MVEKKKVETGLYKKMAEVMKVIEYLKKDDTVAFGNTRYNAMSEEKVTNAVRKVLVEQGLVIFPTEQDVTCLPMEKYDRENRLNLVGFLTTTNSKYKIVDVDTGQYDIIASSGMGVDSQDKGVGKAMTYSYKYAFLRSFAIPTGDDADKISSEEITAAQQKELDKVSGTAPSKSVVKKPVNKTEPTEAEIDKMVTDKFPGAKVEKPELKRKVEQKASLADDPDVVAMSAKLAEGKVSKKVIEALIRSYTAENKATLLRIMESKL